MAGSIGTGFSSAASIPAAATVVGIILVINTRALAARLTCLAYVATDAAVFGVALGVHAAAIAAGLPHTGIAAASAVIDIALEHHTGAPTAVRAGCTLAATLSAVCGVIADVSADLIGPHGATAGV